MAILQCMYYNVVVGSLSGVENDDQLNEKKLHTAQFTEKRSEIPDLI